MPLRKQSFVVLVMMVVMMMMRRRRGYPSSTGSVGRVRRSSDIVCSPTEGCRRLRIQAPSRTRYSTAIGRLIVLTDSLDVAMRH